MTLHVIQLYHKAQVRIERVIRLECSIMQGLRVGFYPAKYPEENQAFIR
jgi:hypothetical protein